MYKGGTFLQTNQNNNILSGVNKDWFIALSTSRQRFFTH